MWHAIGRPGYFGRERDKKTAELDAEYGKNHWTLVWQCGQVSLTFVEACHRFYEESYFRHLSQHPQDVDLICSYGECYDNAKSNVDSGLDYTRQESYSTHIQDIAIRNVLYRMNRWFTGPKDKLLQIRSKDSEGFRFGPGNIPFAWPQFIMSPSLCPWWANAGSVEDFWQSNKMLEVWRP